jgi:hypothetical protein
MSRKVILALAAWLTVGVKFALAQQQPTPAQMPPVAKPGAEHAILKQIEGTWDAVVTGADGKKSKAEAVYKMECGGLWLTSDFKGQMDGQPFQGKGLDTYDPAKKKYTSVWVDSMSTAPMIFEGTRDESTKTTTQTGESPGPDGKPMKFKGVSKENDDDHMTFSMYSIGSDGKETKLMTIDYARRKK